MRLILSLVLSLGLMTGAALGGGYRLLRIDGLAMKWGEPRLGAGATVSWGLATARETFPDAINCREMAPAAAVAAAWGIDEPALAALAEAAFAMWSAAADVAFRRASAGERPDILIGAQAEPDRIAFANVLWDAGAAAGGVAPLVRASVCVSPEIGPQSEPAGRGLDLRTVLAHEIGHAIGLDHPGAEGSLMGFRNQGELERLLPGDVAGGRALYGAP